MKKITFILALLLCLNTQAGLRIYHAGVGVIQAGGLMSEDYISCRQNTQEIVSTQFAGDVAKIIYSILPVRVDYSFETGPFHRVTGTEYRLKRENEKVICIRTTFHPRGSQQDATISYYCKKKYD